MGKANEPTLSLRELPSISIVGMTNPCWLAGGSLSLISATHSATGFFFPRPTSTSTSCLIHLAHWLCQARSPPSKSPFFFIRCKAVERLVLEEGFFNFDPVRTRRLFFNALPSSVSRESLLAFADWPRSSSWTSSSSRMGSNSSWSWSFPSSSSSGVSGSSGVRPASSASLSASFPFDWSPGAATPGMDCACIMLEVKSPGMLLPWSPPADEAAPASTAVSFVSCSWGTCKLFSSILCCSSCWARVSVISATCMALIRWNSMRCACSLTRLSRSPASFLIFSRFSSGFTNSVGQSLPRKSNSSIGFAPEVRITCHRDLSSRILTLRPSIRKL
mmetsp:Transcript_49647/g.94875  ORF Transcript_49647/g.94875 Transcript_49647/m.94875 type:complete len:332 (-) Transcript_49647:129-1124(-)